MEHCRVLMLICTVLSIFTAIHGRKCVQCGYKPPNPAEMVRRQTMESIRPEMYGKIMQAEAEKQAKDPGCPAQLPEATKCNVTELLCIKMEYDGKTSRFCHQLPKEGCHKNGDVEECSHSCSTDGCNNAERVAKKSNLFIMLVTLSLMTLFML